MAEGGDQQQERTEQATPKRIQDARKKGQVAKSMEINSSAILFISLLFFFFGGGYMLNTMKFYCQVIFENYDSIVINADNIQGFIKLGALGFLKVILPFILVIMMIGLAINFLQVGFLFTLEPLQPKFSKINPLQGIKRVLFSRKAVVELAKGILKIALIGGIAYYAIKGQVDNYVPMVDQSVTQVLLQTGSMTLSVGLKIAIALLILAILDYIFQRYDYAKGLRMTKQEVKEEFKQLEGDPHIKGRIRSLQREMSRRRMLDDVHEADVVITNPTHIAIALKYKPDEMEAPLVVAKGREKIAERIREVAREHDVPIVEDKPLAWALYKAVDIGDMIPEDLFQAVAEILAYVYKLKNKEISGSDTPDNINLN